MADDDLLFETTAAKAPPGDAAAKSRILNPDGSIVKGDAAPIKFWLFKVLRCPNIPECVAALLLEWINRPDVLMLSGQPAPGLDLRRRHPRWGSESWGAEATLLAAPLSYILFDYDGIKVPEGSTLGRPEHVLEQALYVREEILPKAFRDVEMVIRVSSSTGFDPLRIHLHAYALLDQPTPLATIHRYLKSLQLAGVRVDPMVALPAQPIYSARPLFRGGLTDPIDPGLRVFTLPGFKSHVTDLDWDEFAEQLAEREVVEQKMRRAGAQRGWRGILDEGLGPMPGEFFSTITAAMGRGIADGIPIDELAGAMHAVISNHPDCDADRRHRYSVTRLRQDLKRLSARDARCVAQIDEIRSRLVVPTAEAGS